MGWLARVLRWLGIGLVALLAGGAIYQQVGLLIDAQYAPPASDLVQVDGRIVHIECMGSGPRSFLLDAGAGAGVFEWFRLMPLLARVGRVCAFERPGLGWSDPGPGEHDALAAADNLSRLVRAARVQTPFIYVGHSLGANFAQVYAAKHRSDVAALILLEPGMPDDLLEDFHGTRGDAFAASDCTLTCWATEAATLLGVVRLASLAIGHKTFDEHHRALYQAYLARPAVAMTTLAELNATYKTAFEDQDVRSYGGTPVLIYVSSKDLGDGSFAAAAQYQTWRIKQHNYFVSLVTRSRHGEGPLVVPQSTHVSMTLGKAQTDFVARTTLAFLERANL